MALFDEEEGYEDPAIYNERYEDNYLQASILFRNPIRTCEESQENEREGNNFRHSGNPDEAASMTSGTFVHLQAVRTGTRTGTVTDSNFGDRSLVSQG